MDSLISSNSPSGQLNKSISCETKFDFNDTNRSSFIRCNSLPFGNEKSSRKNSSSNNCNNISSDEGMEMKMPLVGGPGKFSELLRSRKVSDSSKKSQTSESHTSKDIKTNPYQKWSKLRAVMTMTAAIKTKKPLERQDSFIMKFTTQRGGNDDEYSQETYHIAEIDPVVVEVPDQITRFIIEPNGKVMSIWMGIVTVAVLYNLWTSIARQAFTEILRGYEKQWIALDIIADIIYLLDIAVQLRTSYLERGLRVLDPKKLSKRYIKCRNFIIDLICLTPLDLLQILLGFQPLLRFPRFLKVYRAWKWKIMMENRTIFPNLWRVVNLTHILFLGCHWFAAFYYLISQVEGFQSSWGYPKPIGDFSSVTRKYLKSFYWSVLTLTTIGDLPPPEKNWEYVFTIVSYLIGVFVFATIVGQVGNVITNRNANRLEFEKILDNAKNFMRVHNVPKDLQRRVMRWYDYAWSRGRTSGCSDISSLALLPDKLKTEMALHVNLETLKKVTIFQECRPEFLHDLVLKMRPFIFTPGDLICRKGEVAREMFIISDGVLEVISDSGEVLKKMGSGDFFGEIGILNLDGGINRRTADVKSVGYAELFVLSKEDVLTALQDHPDAEKLIIKYGTSRLNEMKDRRCQRGTKSKPVHTQDSNNQSIEKSSVESNSVINSPDDHKPPEVQTVSVIKNILNRIKMNKQQNSMTTTTTCTHGSQIYQTVKDKSTCDHCAIANLANIITRENAVSKSYSNNQLNTRLNSVPSLLCQNPFPDGTNSNTPFWTDFPKRQSEALPWKECLSIPKLYQSRKRSQSALPVKNDEDLFEETMRNIEKYNASSDAIDFNKLTVGENSRPASCVTEKTDHFFLNSIDGNPFDQSKTKSGDTSLLSNADRNLLLLTLEKVVFNQTKRTSSQMQNEIDRLKIICSNQENEIKLLREKLHLSETHQQSIF